MPSTPFRSMTLAERAEWEAGVRVFFPHIRLRWLAPDGPPGGDDTVDNILWLIAHDVDPSRGAEGKMTYFSQATGYWYEPNTPAPDGRWYVLPAAQFCEDLRLVLQTDTNMFWPYGDSTDGLADPWGPLPPDWTPPEGGTAPAPSASSLLASAAARPSPRPLLRPPAPGIGQPRVLGLVPRTTLVGA